jgi:hypothetical protein
MAKPAVFFASALRNSPGAMFSDRTSRLTGRAGRITMSSAVAESHFEDPGQSGVYIDDGRVS